MTNEELVALIQAGERDRLPELWGQVERFAASRANRLLIAMGERAAAHGLEFDDLYNSGYLALVDAAARYDPEAGMKFIGLFALCLKTAFAEAGGYRGSKRDPLNQASSMDAPLGREDERLTLESVIPDPRAAQALLDVEDRLYQQQLHAALERALGTLTEDEEAVIRGRYYQGRALSEIGPQARSLEQNALRKLRRPKRKKELEQFLEERTPYYMRAGVQAFRRTSESAVERIIFKREQLRRQFDGRQ